MPADRPTRQSSPSKGRGGWGPRLRDGSRTATSSKAPIRRDARPCENEEDVLGSGGRVLDPWVARLDTVTHTQGLGIERDDDQDGCVRAAQRCRNTSARGILRFRRANHRGSPRFDAARRRRAHRRIQQRTDVSILTSSLLLKCLTLRRGVTSAKKSMSATSPRRAGTQAPERSALLAEQAWCCVRGSGRDGRHTVEPVAKKGRYRYVQPSSPNISDRGHRKSIFKVKKAKAVEHAIPAPKRRA